jgi:hypothetical protein
LWYRVRAEFGVTATVEREWSGRKKKKEKRVRAERGRTPKT